MRRKHIVENYDLENGIIKSPGKFEGEMLYVPYFWETGLEGFADEDIDGVWFFTISDEDRKEFPELSETDYGIALEESGQGFVYAKTYTRPEYEKQIRELEKMAEESSETL